MTAQQLIKHFKTITAAAKATGYTRQAIWLWTRKGIPARTQEVIKAKTGGKLKITRG
jgi:molybdenum-dependent DNA-binding transcriptional regulator ModE